ncbi:MAG: HAMP domain-containing histidine kinase [Calditrichaceae bacterium]|nr:HAMP domain-containing histidine kinase [Calditrichaceae bacterium]MBN2709057.1 HAMP domain-containing histidine kinase [Calditrichaceae bacterium]RQV97015.1 MAG: sensor histidine kinase [Calditrichota bacterium]
MFKSVKNRFILFSLLFIVLSVSIPSMFLLYLFNVNFKQRSEVMLKTSFEVINNCLRHVMMHDDKDVDEVIERYNDVPNLRRILFFNEQGIVTFSSEPQLKNKYLEKLDDDFDFSELNKGPVITHDLSQGTVSVIDRVPNSRECRSCHGNAKNIAYINLEAKMTPAESYFYTGTMHIFFLAAAIIIIIFLGFYFMFNKFINKPLKQVIKAMDDVEGGNLDTQLIITKEDEFGILFRHFNRMAGTLKDNGRQIEELHFEQLRRADRLVKLGELAAEMAHEINNPIGVIMTRTDFLQMEAADSETLKKYLDDLDVIQKQVNKISGITGSILKYGKKLPKNFSKVKLEEIIKESLSVLQPRISKKNIKIKKEINCDGCLINGDQQQLEQAFINIINNAVDAVDEEGTIDIKISKNEKEELIVQIMDDGMGMDDRQIGQIFNPFYTTKSVDKGTGLGLYIVKKILQNHHAEIICKSNLGQGTTFIVQFNFSGEKNEKNTDY